MFLTDADLEALTGYQRPRWQKAWLRERGYPHETDSQGRPRVLRAVVLKRLGGEEEAETAGTRPRLRL